MCGIAGYRVVGSEARLDWVESMCRQLVHRGPDGSGEVLRGDVALGHRRLSIIDLAHSVQPMLSKDGRYAITFNGEIFNYGELRTALHNEGVEFRTSGDTEVLLHVLIRWGKDGLHRLNGQFAFGFHDLETNELLLCRDRLGILPVYYYLDGDKVAFASEIKAILALPWVKAELDESAIEWYLATRSTCAPQTLFANIRKLEAGTYLVMNGSGEVSVTRWWDLPRSSDEIRDEDHATEQVEQHLRAAVEARLIADVPVGTYLSGGLDSSLVTTIASQCTDKQIACFVAGFGDSRFDEVPYARLVAQHCGANLEVVALRESEFIDAYERLTWHRDAPLSEPGDVAVYFIAKQAAGSVKVLLSGEGADETFAGYPKHVYDKWARWLDPLPSPFRSRLFRLLEERCSVGSGRMRVGLRALATRSREERWSTWFAPFTWYDRQALKPGYGALVRDTDPVELDPVNQMLRRDCGQWLSDNLLERGDRMSMAGSIENRPPFLDHKLVELSFRIPGHMKCKGNAGKVILRRIASGLVPQQVIERKKVGFKVPIDEWFRRGMREYALDHLLGTDSFVSDYFSRQFIQALCDRHMKGHNEDIRIWTLLGLEVWHKRFLRP